MQPPIRRGFYQFPETQAFSYNDVARTFAAIATGQDAENAVREGKKTFFTEAIKAFCDYFGLENPYATKDMMGFVDAEAIWLVTSILMSPQESENYQENPPLKVSKPFAIDDAPNRDFYLRTAEIETDGKKMVAMFLCDKSRLEEKFNPEHEFKIYQRPDCSFETISDFAKLHPTSFMKPFANVKLAHELHVQVLLEEMARLERSNVSRKFDNKNNVHSCNSTQHANEKTPLIHRSDESRNLSGEESYLHTEFQLKFLTEGNRRCSVFREEIAPLLSRNLSGERSDSYTESQFESQLKFFAERNRPCDVSRDFSRQEIAAVFKSAPYLSMYRKNSASIERSKTFPIRDWSQFKNGDKLSDKPVSIDSPNFKKASNERVDQFLKLINITERVDDIDLPEYKKGLADKITDHLNPRASKYIDINGDRIKLSPTEEGMKIRILKNFRSIPLEYMNGDWQYGAPVGFIPNLTFDDFQNLRSSSESGEFHIAEGLEYKNETGRGAKTAFGRLDHFARILASIFDTKIDRSQIDSIIRELTSEDSDDYGTFTFPYEGQAHDAVAMPQIKNKLIPTNGGMLIARLFENEEVFSHIGFVPGLTFDDCAYHRFCTRPHFRRLYLSSDG